ncbi:unnamed protein product [Cunninghamella echinulata]
MVDITRILAVLDTIDYKQYVIVFSNAIFLFEQYLNYRQYKRYLLPNCPKDLADIVSEEDFKKAQKYNLDKFNLVFS